jgi:hypothetical protein
MDSGEFSALYAAVFDLVADAAERSRERQADAFVYFIQCGPGGAFKIGRTNSAQERLSALQTANPTPLRLWCALQGDDRLEKAIHEKLDRFRLRGEWFACTELVRTLVVALAYLQRHIPQDAHVRVCRSMAQAWRQVGAEA